MEDDLDVFVWKSFRRQLMVASMAWAIYFMYGLALGTPTVAVPQLRASSAPHAVSDDMASWISSVICYMSVIWVFILTITVHRYGIKTTSVVQVINTFTAFAIVYFSQNPTQLLIGQIFHGCTMASQSTTPLLILTEYTTPRYRGVFLTIKSAIFFWGIWVANAMGLYFPYKYIGLLGILCTIYVFIIMLLIPESPYWLARNERYEECAAAHRWVKGSGAEKELDALITTQKTHKRREQPRKTLLHRANYYVNLVTQPDWYNPIGVITLLHMMYMSSGKMVLTLYSIDIIKKITNSQSTAHNGMLILDGITVFGMYAGCGLAKILKRRRLFLIASSLANAFLFIIAAYLFLVRLEVIKENSYVSLALLVAFSLAVACGPMIMVTTIIGELLPVESRCFSLCCSACFTNTLGAVMIKVAPQIIYVLGVDGTFLLFASITTIAIAILYKCLPETKDKTLLEIHDYFTKDKALKFELVSLTKPKTTD